uniref:Uncharacterized protein n=1 Tax=Arundo donax TaxID=35708 RepID=A0A0A9HH64_ARUDO
MPCNEFLNRPIRSCRKSFSCPRNSVNPCCAILLINKIIKPSKISLLA